MNFPQVSKVEKHMPSVVIMITFCSYGSFLKSTIRLFTIGLLKLLLLFDTVFDGNPLYVFFELSGYEDRNIQKHEKWVG